MTQLSDGIFPIANTDVTNLQADIVFVHGLSGDAFETWRNGKQGHAAHFFWPQELGKDLPHCAIWTVGYPAGITTFSDPGMMIEKRAGNIAQKLVNSGLGKLPIIFITHSMGGLLIKRLVVTSQIQPDVEYKNLVRMIRGIVFCATPHRGSDFATAASILGTFFGNVQSHVAEMHRDSEQLDLLHDRFVEWHRNNPVPIKSYAEHNGLLKRKWWGRPVPLGCVVSRSSANPNIAGHVVDDVDYDHLNLVKPHDRSHDVYLGVLRFIKFSLTAPIDDQIPSRFGPKPLLQSDSAISAWLASVDAGEYASVYDNQLAKLACARFDRATFLTLLENERRPLGAVISRKLGGAQTVTAVEGWPTAFYECKIFRTQFATGGERQESVWVMGENGAWRVTSHQISPYQLASRCAVQ